MLMLKGRNEDWIEVEHRSGEVLRILVARGGPVDLGFEDPERNFAIRRRRCREPGGVVGSGGLG